MELSHCHVGMKGWETGAGMRNSFFYSLPQITTCRVKARGRRPNKQYYKTQGRNPNKRARSAFSHGTRPVIICAIHKGTKAQNTQHGYSHTTTDILTIIDSIMVNKGHIYTNTISGNRGQLCIMKVPGEIRDTYSPLN